MAQTVDYHWQEWLPYHHFRFFKELQFLQKRGKWIALWFDIMPQLRGFHDYKKVEKNGLFKRLGFNRVYFCIVSTWIILLSPIQLFRYATDKGTGITTLESFWHSEILIYAICMKPKGLAGALGQYKTYESGKQGSRFRPWCQGTT